MTDGISADSVRGPAQRLKASGAEVFAVGLGRKFSYRQLAYMATDSRHIFKQDFSALARALKPMARTVCKGELRSFMIHCVVLCTSVYNVFVILLLIHIHTRQAEKSA